MLSLLSPSSSLLWVLARSSSRCNAPTPHLGAKRPSSLASRFCRVSSATSHSHAASGSIKASKTLYSTSTLGDFRQFNHSRRKRASENFSRKDDIPAVFSTDFLNSPDYAPNLDHVESWKPEANWKENPVHLQKLRQLAAKLPRVDARVIQGDSNSFRPSKLSPAGLALLGETVKALDAIVTQNAAMSVPSALDLLHVVQAFPDQLSQWASLHLVEPRSRSAQLWALGVLQALARLQHPLTVDLWLVAKDADVEIPISLFVELCHYFGQSPTRRTSRSAKPPTSTSSSHDSPADSRSSPSSSALGAFSAKAGPYRELSSVECAIQLQNVLKRAKQTGNAVVILACWNYTIQGLLKQGDIAGADRELSALQRMGLAPTLETLQAFIVYYSKRISKDASYVEKVSAYHARIKKMNLSPDLNTYSEILRCYERSFRYKQMDSVLLEMTHSQLQAELDSSQHPSNASRTATSAQNSLNSSHSGPNALPSQSNFPHSTSNTFSREGHAVSSKDAGVATIQVRGPRAIQTGHISEELLPTPIKPRGSSSTTTVQKDDAEEGAIDAAFDLETRKALLAQKAGAIPAIPLGNVTYDGGAQWLGGGRKQPNKLKVQKQVSSILNILSSQQSESTPSTTPASDIIPTFTSSDLPEATRKMPQNSVKLATNSTASSSSIDPTHPSFDETYTESDIIPTVLIESRRSRAAQNSYERDDAFGLSFGADTPMSSLFGSNASGTGSSAPQLSGVHKRAQETHTKALQRSKVVEAWSRAIYSALDLGSMRKAMVLVEEMESLGLEVNDRICTEFMYYAGKNGRIELLHRWWQKLNTVMAPSNGMLRKHHLIYMRELLRLNYPVEARKVMTQICETFGHSDDAYALWIRFYSSKDLSTSVEHTMRQMEAHNVEYGLYTISALLQLFARKGDQPNMFVWFDRLKAKSNNVHALDEVLTKCIFSFKDQGHSIGDVKIWTDALPPPSGTRRDIVRTADGQRTKAHGAGVEVDPARSTKPHFPRLMGALMSTLGCQLNETGFNYIIALCSEWKSPYTLVGLIEGSSFLPASPSRDRRVVEYIESCASLKHMLSAAQNDDVFQALTYLEMPALILEWADEIATLPSHVVEPTQRMFHHIFKASIDTGNPEAFVSFATKAYDKFGVAPKFRTIAACLRAIIHSRTADQIAGLATPLVELCPRDLSNILTVLDEELTQVGIARPPSLTSPAKLANPTTLDLPAYITRRLGKTRL